MITCLCWFAVSIANLFLFFSKIVPPTFLISHSFVFVLFFPLHCCERGKERGICATLPFSSLENHHTLPLSTDLVTPS